MSDVSIERLRKLRERARDLLKHTGSDLVPFLHSDGLTFRRKPDSESKPGDVNVTTTCSCLMALALTNQLSAVYANGKDDCAAAFDKLVHAPWMSSGLTENNAFTTTLVLRTLGFLIQEHILTGAEIIQQKRKEWDLRLGIRNVTKLAEKIYAKKDSASSYLWKSISDDGRRALDQMGTQSKNAGSAARLTAILSLEIGRLIQSGWIYERTRFPKASAKTRHLLDKSTTTYQLTSANRLLLVDSYPKLFAPVTKRSLAEIASMMSSDESHFRINEYSPSAAVVYWFVDGVVRGEIDLSRGQWSSIANWAAGEFNRQRSLVGANHEAMMDPVSMAMAACLCSRLRAVSEAKSQTASAGRDTENHIAVLPSRPELEHSIRELFRRQTSGIWPKYFPLFHYPDAGSNFCFTFELLEAVLVDFARGGSELLDDDLIIAGLENAVSWCEDNRLPWPSSDGPYNGWNSGGYLETLKKRQPESWATAVVHMFVWEVEQATSERLQKRLLRSYDAHLLDKDDDGLDDLLDIEIVEKGSPPQSLRTILKSEFIEHYKTENQSTLLSRSIKAPRSALLFGPPGTSKTKLAEALAHDLNWPLIQIDPSHFLEEGLDGIYLQAERIFNDLMDLSGVLVLFDEMDALVQTRDISVRLDMASQFLTTFMLPKLADLHDRGRLIFLMATNFQERFDAAIKRTGRFDLLLCMGPPSLDAKLAGLHKFVGEDEPTEQTRKGAEIIARHLRALPETKAQLELYTFGEFRSLIKRLSPGTNKISNMIEKLSQRDLANQVEKDSKYVGLRLADLSPLSAIVTRPCKTIEDIYSLELNRKELERLEIEVTPVIRYLLDRQESKRQS